MISKDVDSDVVFNAFPIAGDLKNYGGGDLDPKWTRLKTSESALDKGKEGVRLEIKGGFRQQGNEKRNQKAFVEFLCDRSRIGNENLWNPEDKYVDGNSKREEKEDSSPSLEFVSYEASGDNEDVLKLKWRTKYACEGAKQETDAEKSHWGFFTWFIIMYVFHPLGPDHLLAP